MLSKERAAAIYVNNTRPDINHAVENDGVFAGFDGAYYYFESTDDPCIGGCKVNAETGELSTFASYELSAAIPVDWPDDPNDDPDLIVEDPEHWFWIDLSDIRRGSK